MNEAGQAPNLGVLCYLSKSRSIFTQGWHLTRARDLETGLLSGGLCDWWGLESEWRSQTLQAFGVNKKHRFRELLVAMTLEPGAARQKRGLQGRKVPISTHERCATLPTCLLLYWIGRLYSSAKQWPEHWFLTKEARVKMTDEKDENFK